MLAGRWLAAILLYAGLANSQTVFLFSFDGFGHQFFTRSAAASPLKSLRKLAARGAMADGIQPAFPSTTANSHCALWTGAYGDITNITANSEPRLPRSEHSFLERISGYRAEQLAAEPIWVTAARQGVKAVAYQATQVIPFGPMNTHPNAVAVNSYQTQQVSPHGVYRRKDLRFTSPDHFQLQHGAVKLSGRILKNGLLIEDKIRVIRTAAEASGPANRALARHFSEGLFLDQPAPAVIYFRLFEFSRDDLLLYVSPVHELAFSQGDPRAMLKAAGGAIGNSFESPALSTAQAMEIMELAARQNFRQTEWLYRTHRPRLMIGYHPYSDELGHRWLGLYERGDAEALRAMEWGYAIVERWTSEILKLVGKKDHIVITADHGMAPTHHLVNVDEVLRRAGLASQATHVYSSVLLNTTDWKGGIVEDREAIRKRVQSALESVRNPDPVFTAFFTPEEHGAKYGIGGPATSDLYFDLAPGYYMRDVKGEIFPKLDRPTGNHGFRPDREDMLAVLIAAGPRIKAGTRWPRLKSIDVAPLVADLLGIEPPRNAVGRSPRN